MDLGPKFIKRARALALGQFSHRRRRRLCRLLPPAAERTLPVGVERAMRPKIEPIFMQQVPCSHLLLRRHGVTPRRHEFLTRHPHPPRWSLDQAIATSTLKLRKRRCDTLRKLRPKIHRLSQLRRSGDPHRPAKAGGGCRAGTHIKTEGSTGRGRSVVAKGSGAARCDSIAALVEALRLPVRGEHKS